METDRGTSIEQRIAALAPGEPYCGQCGYDLRGATEAARCPECGGALVDVLMRRRGTLGAARHRRYRSPTVVWGLPLIDVAFGPRPEFDEPMGRARGVLALGDSAVGVIAVGGRAVGVVAVGGVAIGGFTLGGVSLGAASAVGGCSVGGLAMGGTAVGGLTQGGVAVGVVAKGGVAVGVYAAGGQAVGMRTATGPRATPQGRDAFDHMAWYFGGSGPAPAIGQAAALQVGLMIIVAAVVWAFAMDRARRNKPLG